MYLQTVLHSLTRQNPASVQRFTIVTIHNDILHKNSTIIFICMLCQQGYQIYHSFTDKNDILGLVHKLMGHIYQ